MQFRQWKAYLVLLPGLMALGCGDDGTTKEDAGTVVRMDAAKADTAIELRDTLMDLAVDLFRPADTSDLPSQVDALVLSDGPLPDRGIPDTGTRPDRAPDLPDAIRPLDAASIDSAMIDAADAADALMTTDSAGGDAAGSDALVASLTPGQVVPAVNNSAMGQVYLELSASGTMLTYHLTHNLAAGTQAGIYLGAGGETGRQLFDLRPFGTDMRGTLTISAADAANLVSGMLYVEVRSNSQPGGVLRGQILRPGETLWVARLTGAQAVPPVSTSANGHAAFILNAERDNVRYHLATSGFTPTAARIQIGIAAMAGGPVAYSLTPVRATMDGVIAVEPGDLPDLDNRHWYVNITSVANPNGELRGQVLMPGESLYSASLKGGNEVPPIQTSATGAAQFVLGLDGTTLMYEAAFVGLVANAAHLHLGATGMNGAVVYPLTVTEAGAGARGTLALTAADLLILNIAGYYMNAHTVANPGGEIRGQVNKQ